MKTGKFEKGVVVLKIPCSRVKIFRIFLYTSVTLIASGLSRYIGILGTLPFSISSFISKVSGDALHGESRNHQNAAG